MRYAGILGVAALTLTFCPFVASMPLPWAIITCASAIATWIAFIAALYDTEAV